MPILNPVWGVDARGAMGVQSLAMANLSPGTAGPAAPGDRLGVALAGGRSGMMGAPCRGLGRRIALCYLIARHSAEEIAMALSATRSVPVPEDMGSFVDDLVARGDYADAADVIRAGLQALRDRE
ncbi:hypothetical protein GE253_17240 [Niveispirillum sp. SYP-B3756]|nr:hypothetical protein [Niveispirillum sp. SYP-B3756]